MARIGNAATTFEARASLRFAFRHAAPRLECAISISFLYAALRREAMARSDAAKRCVLRVEQAFVIGFHNTQAGHEYSCSQPSRFFELISGSSFEFRQPTARW